MIGRRLRPMSNASTATSAYLGVEDIDCSGNGKELKQAPILAQGRLCPIRTGRVQQSGRWPAARRHYRLSSVLLQGLHADLIPDFHGQMEGAVGGGYDIDKGVVVQTP